MSWKIEIVVKHNCWFQELKNINCCEAQLVWTLESRALRSSTASGSPKSTLFFSCPFTPHLYRLHDYQMAGNLLETGLDRALRYSDWTTTVSFHFRNSMTHLIHAVNSFSQKEWTPGDHLSDTNSRKQPTIFMSTSQHTFYKNDSFTSLSKLQDIDTTSE